MVPRHFNLREQPFGVTPDPRYLYASSTHREALASLLYGVESGLGFVALTANPGMGKTTLLFEALRRMQETARTVFLFQTIATPIDLVRALLIDLGIKEVQGTLVELQTRLNEVLVEQATTGKRLIVVIDEAQNLDESVLEAVRMLSNFETARQKLMHIILAGQLQLADKLAQPQLLQLRQRISIFAHLEALSSVETAAYIQHRLRVAGHYSDESIFTSSALSLIAQASQGIPRNINNICFNSLTLGCALQRKTIDVDMIREVLTDLDFHSKSTPPEAPEEVLREAINTSRSRTTSRPKLSKIKVVVIPLAVCAIVALFAWLILQDYHALTGDTAVAANSNASSEPQAVPGGLRTDVPAVEPAASSTTVRSEVPEGQPKYTGTALPI
jgi:general secretion pathway protein A